MTVFKTFLKVLNKCKLMIIINTVMLIIFGSLHMQTSDSSINFEASKPNILIVNNDENKEITNNLVKYLKENCNTPKIKNDKDAISDALFYRKINYIISIPKDYSKNFLDGKNPEIEVKSTGDAQGSYAEMILSRYIKVANIYQKNVTNQGELVKSVNETLKKQTEVEVTSKLDTNNLQRADFFYNFANYSILAGCVYVICLILSSFKDEKVRKRTVISSMNYRKHNRILLLSNTLFALILWLFYVLLSFILVGNIMFTINGLMYIINSFIFTLCAVTIALLIGNLLNNKEAINGIVNVVALGSSFLCGAFVPMQWLPDSVLAIAHILPSYYYIINNEIITTMETFNFETIVPLLVNMGIVLIFALGFIVITNIVSRKKRKIG